MKLLLASRNPDKARELAELLPGTHFILWPGHAPDIPEDGSFFQDNALQKASHALRWWLEQGGEPIDGALADDSGLCVDALWGGPGVLSARFALDLDYDRKNRKLIAMMPVDTVRSARFVCALALVPVRGEACVVCGAVEGRIAHEPRGSQGFGYDPIFIPEGFDQTFGELSASVKHGMSHRGRAARALATRISGMEG